MPSTDLPLPNSTTANMYRSALEKNKFDSNILDKFIGTGTITRTITSTTSKAHMEATPITIIEQLRKYASIDTLIEDLQTKPVKTVKQLLKMHPLTIQELENLCVDNFSAYISFVVFGCSRSTDIDVACFVDSKYIDNGKPFPLAQCELQRLEKELTEAGYSVIDRGLDINLLCVNAAGRIIACTKGGSETQNIILQTHHLHKQYYDTLPALTHVMPSVFDKIKAISKFMLDYLEHVSPDYAEMHANKKKIYECIDSIIAFTKTMDFVKKMIVVDHADIGKYGLRPSKWFDYMKSITMKYLQLILLEHGILEYTKDGLVEQSFSVLQTHYKSYGNITKDNIAFLLFRGTTGVFSPLLLPMLHQIYIDAIDKYNSSITAKTIIIPFDTLTMNNPSIMTMDLFLEFLKSPVNASTEFERLWNDHKYNIDEIFPIVSTEAEHRPCFVNDTLSNKFIWIDQRTPEWHDLLTFYTCGTNSKNIGNSFQSIYNLIRGTIAELLIMNLFQPQDIFDSSYTKYSVGMLAEHVGTKGSNGCAPDLLLINDTATKIIPVEIKSLHSATHNSDYYRGYDLALKQCQRVKDILDPSNTLDIINQGLIILSWFASDGSLELECITCQL